MESILSLQTKIVLYLLVVLSISVDSRPARKVDEVPRLEMSKVIAVFDE